LFGRVVEPAVSDKVDHVVPLHRETTVPLRDRRAGDHVDLRQARLRQGGEILPDQFSLFVDREFDGPPMRAWG